MTSQTEPILGIDTLETVKNRSSTDLSYFLLFLYITEVAEADGGRICGSHPPIAIFISRTHVLPMVSAAKATILGFPSGVRA